MLDGGGHGAVRASLMGALLTTAVGALLPAPAAGAVLPPDATAAALFPHPADRQATVVYPRGHHDDGLSGGAIAGIVIGSVAAFLLLVGILVAAYRLSRPPTDGKKKGADAAATATADAGTRTWGPTGGGWTSMFSFAAPAGPPPPHGAPYPPPHGAYTHGCVPAHHPCPPPPVARPPGSSIWRVPFRAPFTTKGAAADCRSCGFAACVCCVVCCVTPCRCLVGGMRCGTCRQGQGSCRCGGRGGGGRGGRSAVTCKTCRMAPCSCTDCRS